MSEKRLHARTRMQKAATREAEIVLARDEVVRAAVALVTARYSEIGMSPDKNNMALFDAVAALTRLEKP